MCERKIGPTVSRAKIMHACYITLFLSMTQLISFEIKGCCLASKLKKKTQILLGSCIWRCEFCFYIGFSICFPYLYIKFDVAPGFYYHNGASALHYKCWIQITNDASKNLHRTYYVSSISRNSIVHTNDVPNVQLVNYIEHWTLWYSIKDLILTKWSHSRIASM